MRYRNSILAAALVIPLCLLCTSCPRPSEGTVADSLRVEGARRTFLVHVPMASNLGVKRPLLIVLHPFTGTGRSMEQLTGFSSVADSEGFIVAYPDGRQRVWNANPASPSSLLGAPADDVAFVSALIDYLIEKHNADPDRVYVAGASSGGLMTHRVACELTDKLAAAAAVMITLPTGWQDREDPAKPLPFLMIQGVADPFFPWEGGTVNEGPFRKHTYQSAADTVAFWVAQNNANPSPVETNLPDTSSDDGTTVFERHYAAQPEGAEVILYGINGGGHTWPGSTDDSLKFLVGTTSQDINASKVIWDFLKTHSRQD